MEPNPRQEAIQRLMGANNVLVTVSSNPSVDQLAAAIGFTLFLNRLGKHGTAVFSGKVPSTIEFLKPEETLEKNTDSLRDFIIALDKSKADKLRYKVEDTYVKIFITPYKTTLSQNDLEFSQGDFNVDVVIAIGVKSREELDDAITAHGRILHDAAVIAVNNQPEGNLGAINWNEPDASSLCEMLVGLCDSLQPQGMDSQMATSFLTGIVAETDRFGNQRTTAKTMTVSAELIAAGANQQLVASKLDPEEQITLPKVAPKAPAPKPKTNGVLTIEHPETTKVEAPKKKAPEAEINPEEIHIDEGGTLRYTKDLVKDKEKQAAAVDKAESTTTEAVNGRLIDNQSAPDNSFHESAAIESPVLSYGATPSGGSVSGPPPVNDARSAVNSAIKSAPDTGPLPPIQALGAERVELDQPQPPQEETTDKPETPNTTNKVSPPPLPPPMMPPFSPPAGGSATNPNTPDVPL